MKNDESLSRLFSNYKMYSLLEIVIERYMLLEMEEEQKFDDEMQIDKELEIIKKALEAIENKQELSGLICELEECRKLIIEKMQVLTAYIDRLLVFEYVLNRIEYRYKLSENEIEDRLSKINRQECVRDVANYLFEEEDQVVVNGRIRDLVTQLPVRMARSKFFEHVKNSIKLYSESDKSSLDGYLYMLRTAAMIYEPEGMDRYFTSFAKVLEEIAQVDFQTMDKDCYRIISEKTSHATSKIQDITDVYMSIQKIVNLLLVYALNENACEDKYEKYYNMCIEDIALINKAVNGQADAVSDDIFVNFEGFMETLYEEGRRLETVVAGKIDNCEESALIDKIGKLMSSSLFAELEEEEPEPVTAQYLNEKTDELIKDLQEFIKDNQRPVVRAVFALVLGAMPVFFSSSREVVDYITDSLNQCADKAELLATYELIDELCWGD